MNLILFHLTEKKFDLISLRLFSSSVSSHLMKKNLILSHFIKKKSCLILILTQNRIESEQKILILVISLTVQALQNDIDDLRHDINEIKHEMQLFLKCLSELIDL